MRLEPPANETWVLDGNQSANNSIADALEIGWLKLTVLILVFCASVIGNASLVCLSVSIQRSAPIRDDASYKQSSSMPVVDRILVLLALTALCRDATAKLPQLINIIHGAAIFGERTCRVQGFFITLIRYFYLWALSLLCIERYVKDRRPYEYSVTFSVLTVEIIIPGIFLTITSQVTGPLYGFGNYDYISAVWSCDVDVKSAFTCFFLLYTEGCLVLPAFVVLIGCCTVLVKNRHKKECAIKRDRLKTVSRLLNEKLELVTLVGMCVLHMVLTLPRLLLETLSGCQCISSSNHDLTFFIAWLESLTTVVLPFFCFVNVRAPTTPLNV